MKTKECVVDIGSVRWARELEPFLQAVKRRGFVAKTVRELNRVSQGRKWHRQQIDRWLDPDPEKRSEPLAGIGLVLIDAMRRAISGMITDKKASSDSAPKTSKSRSRSSKRGNRLPAIITHSETGS